MADNKTIKGNCTRIKNLSGPKHSFAEYWEQSTLSDILVFHTASDSEKELGNCTMCSFTS
jgi:hypothetical protein